MIPEDEMISVPARLLQDLLANCWLNFVGVELTSKCQECIVRQSEELQEYFEDADPSSDEDDGLSYFAEFNNVEFVNFGKRK